MPGTEAGFSTEMTELEVTLATVDPVAVVGLALNLCRRGWNCDLMTSDLMTSDLMTSDLMTSDLMTSDPAKQFETEILYFPNLGCALFVEQPMSKLLWQIWLHYIQSKALETRLGARPDTGMLECLPTCPHRGHSDISTSCNSCSSLGASTSASLPPPCSCGGR